MVEAHPSSPLPSPTTHITSTTTTTTTTAWIQQQEAGLQEKLHTRIGGILAGGITIKGLSNGEKRRLSVVCAAIANPSILFLDGEPCVLFCFVLFCFVLFCGNVSV
jgi:ABC-type molybdenum transport system ATPase subunit/photorepair protein PhrA